MPSQNSPRILRLRLGHCILSIRSSDPPSPSAGTARGRLRRHHIRLADRFIAQKDVRGLGAYAPLSGRASRGPVRVAVTGQITAYYEQLDH